jgi:hypothetical protein
MTGGLLCVRLQSDGTLQLEGLAEECCQGLIQL